MFWHISVKTVRSVIKSKAVYNAIMFWKHSVLFIKGLDSLCADCCHWEVWWFLCTCDAKVCIDCLSPCSEKDHVNAFDSSWTSWSIGFVISNTILRGVLYRAFPFFYVLQLLSACHGIQCVVQDKAVVSKLRVKSKVGTALCGVMHEWVVKCCGQWLWTIWEAKMFWIVCSFLLPPGESIPSLTCLSYPLTSHLCFHIFCHRTVIFSSWG